MARTQGSESGRARLFLALALPGEARSAIASMRDALTAGREEALRPVADEALHVTLVFLGWQEDGAVERIAAAAFGASASAGSGARAGHAPPLLRATAVRPVPPRRPRLLALDLDDEGGRAASLQAAVSDALAALGAYTPEERPFWPHITLARVRRGTRLTLTPEEGANVTRVMPSAPFETPELVLYRSHLSSKGARYEPLERLALGAG